MAKQKEQPVVETQETKQPQKRHRKWPWVLAGMLIVLVLILLLIPVALSSQRFTRWLGAKISSTTGGQADIGNLSVGWFRGVRVAGFSYRTPDGWAQVNVDRITTQPSYASLLSGDLGLDHTVIDQPRVAIDLRNRPPATEEEPTDIDMDDLARLNDVVVRDGSLQLTDTSGKTVQLANFDSNLSLRRAGRTSKFEVSAVVAQAQTPGRIQASGQITPDRQQGWSLRGTTGDLTVEVNDLDLSSVAPFLEMAGVQVQAQGVVSADIEGAVQDGQIENLNATVVGQNLAVGGEALKGDSLQTSQLNARAGLTRSQNVINIDQLNVQTDWASLTATGRLPTTVQSMTELLESGAAYDLRGKFDVNLAAVLSQMPNTIGVQEGMQITGGRATGTIGTTTEGGRATLVAEAQVTDLAGVVNNEQVALSEPVQASLRLSTDPQEGSRLEGLNVTAPFAQVSAGGDFEQIQYKGQVDLAALQSELGPFVNLGNYQIAGQATSTGQVSIQEGFVGTSGTLSARQIVVTTPDGNSVSEPQANVNFAVGLNQEQQVLTVDTLSANTSFGTINVANATIPTGQNTEDPLRVAVTAQDVDLSALKPYAVVFGGLPQQLGIDGLAQSQLMVTRENGVYRIFTDATQIQDLTLTSPEPEDKPFQQRQVTAMLEAFIDPNAGTFNLARLQLDSPQIKVQFNTQQATEGDTTRLQGRLDAQWDWAAVGQAASAFVPGTVDLAGQRQIALNFASTYPADDPNAMLANLDAKTSLGFERAEYMGLNFGPTEIDVQVENGQMQVQPFSTTVNNGKFNFAAQADLSQTPILLRATGPLQVAQGIQITDEMVSNFLRYVNPIFADAVGVSGIVNFETQSMAIPLTGGAAAAQLAGTIGIQELRLQASLLNKILSVIRESLRDQVLAIRPTKIALQKGVLRYDDMQIDVGDNPVNFGGAIGLDGILDMTVVLPYTYEGRTVRVGEEGQGKRIAVPLTGNLSNPQLDLQKLLEGQLREQIFQRGLEEIFKELQR